MRIERFQQFVQYLKDYQPFISTVDLIWVFRFWENRWYDQDGTILSDEAECFILQQTLSRNTHSRARNSHDSYYAVPLLESVVKTHSRQLLWADTREKIHRVILECLVQSNNAFDASHDQLTGLLNASTTDQAILSTLTMRSGAVSPDLAAQVGSGPGTALALLMLDLDNFKQVNDSYGHEYGDVVLSCFSDRIRTAVSLIVSDVANPYQFTIGRAGGEEFRVVVVGPLTEQAIFSIADRLCKAVENEALPTDAEWSSISSSVKPSGITLPHTTERRVTTSIGISSIATVSGSTDARARMAQLKFEADTALYKAKAGGRNTYRYFPDIKTRFGTVLQYHRDTGIVVIDIGLMVGVLAGQEFRVFHPDFAGKKPYILKDGRTTRQLGEYPRHSSGSLTAFHVQKEVSFCKIAHAEKGFEFPPGSVLESIPAGSIVHLISPESAAQPLLNTRLSTTKHLEEEIDKRVSSNSHFSISIFTLKDMSLHETAKGTAFVNQVLANLYKSISHQYEMDSCISQIQPSQIAVLSKKAILEECKSAAETVIGLARDASTGLVEFTSGIFCDVPNRKSEGDKSEGDKSEGDKSEGDRSQLDAHFALEYARYASSPEATKDSSIAVFSPGLVASVLLELRSQDRRPEAIRDYDRLTQLGIRNAFVENQAAMAFFELPNPDFVKAREIVRIAADLLPSHSIMQLNRATFELACGDFVTAHTIFRQFYKPDSGIPPVYLRPIAFAACRMFETNQLPTVEGLRELIESALKVQSSPVNLNINDSLLQSTLASITSSSAPPGSS